MVDRNRIIIEMYRLGNSVKVTAIDERSGAEATIVGDPKVGRNHLQELAVKKLHYLLDRDKPEPLKKDEDGWLV